MGCSSLVAPRVPPGLRFGEGAGRRRDPARSQQVPACPCFPHCLFSLRFPKNAAQPGSVPRPLVPILSLRTGSRGRVVGSPEPHPALTKAHNELSFKKAGQGVEGTNVNPAKGRGF